jgi:HPt (histidine-containing phosphotransfer) domain-containing protein
MKYLAAIAAAIALLALAAGCGGGGDTSSGSGDSGSGGSDVAATADAACAKANQKIAALSIPDNEQAVVEYLEETEATVEELQDEVAGLDGPAGIAEYAEALDSSLAVLNEMANAARSRNPDGVRELSKELEKLHLGKVAEAAGLETCAEAPRVES